MNHEKFCHEKENGYSLPYCKTDDRHCSYESEPLGKNEDLDGFCVHWRGSLL